MLWILVVSGCSFTSTPQSSWPVLEEEMQEQQEVQETQISTWVDTSMSDESNQQEQLSWAHEETENTTAENTGSYTEIATGVSAEIMELIKERKKQLEDKSKLTEDDIDFMEQIIQKLKKK